MTTRLDHGAGPAGAIRETGPVASYEVRELASAAEYLDCFRLRHSVYSPLGYQRQGNGTGIELDEFDLRARLLGAYDLVTGELAATIRLICAAPPPGRESLHRQHVGLIQQILAGFGDDELSEQVRRPPAYPLPSILSDRVMRCVAAFNVRGDALYELSRGVVRPGRRGLGLARVLMEFGVALAAPDAPATVLGGCLPEHVPMYGRYGFGLLPGTGLESFDSVGQTGYVIAGRTDELAPATYTRVRRLRQAQQSGATEYTLEIGLQEWARCRWPAA